MTRSAHTPTATRPTTAREELSMKRFIAFALLTFALTLSAALANPWVVIDDSGVDYDKTSVEKAYIGLSMNDGNLVIKIDDASFDGALPAIAYDVPDLEDREDFFGNEINAEVTDIVEVRWHGLNDDHPRAAYLVGFDATHEDATLDDVLTAYDRAFRSMGFSAETRTAAPSSLRTVTYSNGDATVDARFHAAQGDVSVELRTN